MPKSLNFALTDIIMSKKRAIFIVNYEVCRLNNQQKISSRPDRDTVRHPSLHLSIIAMITLMVTFGCTIYQKPRPFFDVPFQERSQSKIDGEVKVTVAVLSAEESRQLFGVNLASEGIQPVWIRVQNADTLPYWLMSAGLDPDYFSPLEAAYAFHGTIGSSVNKK